MSNDTTTATLVIRPAVTETVIKEPAITKTVEIKLSDVLPVFEKWARENSHQFAEYIDTQVEINEDGALTGRFATGDSDCSWIDNPIELEVDNEAIEWVAFDNGRQRNEWLFEQAERLGVDLTTDRADSVANVFADVLAAYDAEKPGRRSYAVERYEHSLVRYSILGRGYQCQWDTAPGVAVLTLNTDNVCGPYATDEEYDKAAQAILDEYTSWCNGDAYIVHEVTFTIELEPLTDAVDEEWALVINEIDHDTCGGYLGDEAAKEVVRSGF